MRVQRCALRRAAVLRSIACGRPQWVGWRGKFWCESERVLSAVSWGASSSEPGEAHSRICCCLLFDSSRKRRCIFRQRTATLLLHRC